MAVLPHLLAVLTFALLCGGWVWLQRWIARRAPDVKGPESGCASCSCGGGECRRAPSIDPARR
ncbi:MAG: hypothetical protein H6838_14190 [Planctomycetes bacterium]|nr:hypothetical protein [Planctomycetota bacterium]